MMTDEFVRKSLSTETPLTVCDYIIVKNENGNEETFYVTKIIEEGVSYSAKSIKNGETRTFKVGKCDCDCVILLDGERESLGLPLRDNNKKK